MDTSTKINSEFWNRAAAGYAKKPIADENAYAQTLERVRAHLSISDVVLEVGCGTGTTALRLSPFAHYILATDVSREMIRIARQKAEAQKVTHIEFREGTLDDPSLPLASFDTVMAFNVLHLVPDVSSALERIHELLKPGGWFVSKTPCIGTSLARHVIPLLRLFGKAPPVVYLTPSGLLAQTEAAGFSIGETSHYPTKSHNFFIAARKI